jgi:hypothetical protein
MPTADCMPFPKVAGRPSECSPDLNALGTTVGGRCVILSSRPQHLPEPTDGDAASQIKALRQALVEEQKERERQYDQMMIQMHYLMSEIEYLKAHRK